MHMDKSWQLYDLIRQSGSEGLLGELQYAFVLFLLGQDYAGFEHWKALVVMCCGCQEAITKQTAFFVQFVQVLIGQLNEVPKDFFIDPLSSDNFLRPTLQNLFEVATPPFAEAGGAVQEHFTKLETAANKLRTVVLSKFGWDIGLEDGVEVVEEE